MTFWIVTTFISALLGLASAAFFRQTWAALLSAGLLALLFAPYLGLRFVQDITGHHDAQDGLAFLFGPLVAVPVAALCVCLSKHLQQRRGH
ncbi:hypothetical protein [Stenotrophomonas sp.]|uniref:hypothetical protein n=1 Tax=Stenotrophomonas sp. TaxID=69392 RepID=UPI0028A78D1D|nr:hypothetical protein [Stenotrophomonas sp.]